MAQISDKKAIYEVIKSISGQNNILTIPRIYIDLTGSVKSALFLSQCVYWADKMGKRFYKTYTDWQEEIGLTEREIDTARKDCSTWVKTELHRANGAPTLHYIVDMDSLAMSISTFCTNRLVQNVLIDKDKTSYSLTETTTETTTDINNQEHSTPGKNGDQMKKEEYLKSIEQSLMKGMVGLQTGYAHFPERLIPVVERMERYWFFLPPASNHTKSYSFWIQSCDEILTACGEFGYPLLDDLYKDWRAYLDTHQGLAPFTISSPKSLVNTVAGKAALKRSGNNAPMWKLNDYAKGSQSRLDV